MIGSTCLSSAKYAGMLFAEQLSAAPKVGELCNGRALPEESKPAFE